MFTSLAFKKDDPAAQPDMMRCAVRLATPIVATADGLMATKLPLMLDENEGVRCALRSIGQGQPAVARSLDRQSTGYVFRAGAYVIPSRFAAKQVLRFNWFWAAHSNPSRLLRG